MIVVEGPDGAGKTTLIKRLMGDFPHLELAAKVVDSDTRPMTNLRDWVNDNLAGGFKPAIFDRHRLISEPIYSSVMPREPDADFWDPEWLIPALQVFRQIKPVVIFCLPPWSSVYLNTAHDPNNEVVVPYMHKIYNAYVAAYGNWGTDAKLWDYRHPDREHMYGRIHQNIVFALNTRTESRDVKY